MPARPTRLTAAQAFGSFQDSIRRILCHPANRDRRCRALVLYFAWQFWERIARRPWTIRIGTTRRLRLYPHQTVAALVLYCKVPDYNEMSFVRDYLRSGDLFVDVGANVGIYSLLASEAQGVSALAFEPSSVTYARMVENIELNKLSDRIQVLHRAVGAERAVVRLTTGLDAVNHLVIDAVDVDRSGTEIVEQTTLDSELRDRVPALVKIDVEGAELDVLRGGREAILRHRPPLLVEVNDPEGLAALLADLGYRAWNYDPATREVHPTHPVAGQNVLALADVGQARERLQETDIPRLARGDKDRAAPQPGKYRAQPAQRGKGIRDVYARPCVTSELVLPPNPRSRLPVALKTVIVRRVPLVRLALLRRDLLEQSGWARSGKGGLPVARDGSPIPWYTYSAIHFLEARVRKDMTVFEYGSGHSTLWWAQRVAHVCGVESDPDWIARLLPSLPPNAQVDYQQTGGSGGYAAAAPATGRRFDIVVIDGEDRSACALACLSALNDDGVVIWDNSDWTALWADGMQHLIDSGFRSIDLRGMGPLTWYEWTTSVFYRPAHNCLGI